MRISKSFSPSSLANPLPFFPVRAKIIVFLLSLTCCWILLAEHLPNARTGKTSLDSDSDRRQQSWQQSRMIGKLGRFVSNRLTKHDERTAGRVLADTTYVFLKARWNAIPYHFILGE